MIERWYNVHDLVKIHLHVGELNSARFIDSWFAAFRSEPINASELDLEFLDSIKQHDYSDALRTESFYYCPHERTIWDSNTTVRTEPSGKISVYSDWGVDRFVLTLLMQLQLVRLGFALCHAAGFVIKDSAVIFPSWHLAGKTSLVSFMINQEKVGLLGDEQVIISRKGEVYKLPYPIKIYHYHATEQSPVVNKAFKKKGSIFSSRILEPLYNKLAWRGISTLSTLSPKLLEVIRKFAPLGYVAMPLEELVPAHRLPTKSPVRKVVSLARWSGKSFQMEPCDSYQIVPEMISILYSGELFSSPHIQRFFQYWLTLSAFGAIESWQWLLTSLEGILKEALKGVECYRLRIPEGTKVTDLGKYIMDVIET